MALGIILVILIYEVMYIFIGQCWAPHKFHL